MVANLNKYCVIPEFLDMIIKSNGILFSLLKFKLQVMFFKECADFLGVS